MSRATTPSRQPIGVTRVFVLGAGFSIPAGLPSAVDLVQPVIEEATAGGAVADFAVWIDWLKSAIPDTSKYTINIEELLEYAQNSMEFDRAYQEIGTAREKAGEQLKRTRLFVQRLQGSVLRILWRRQRAVHSAEYVEKFVRSLAPPDPILTFNYDTLLENELTKQGKSWIHRLDDYVPDAIHVLKMHGSVNWFVSRRFDDVPSGDTTVLSGRNTTDHPGALYRINNPRDIQSAVNTLYAAQRTPGMAALGGRKPISEIPGLGWLWALAHGYLQVAETVFIVGFSMSRYDSMTRLLFASAARVQYHYERKIVVIDPDAKRTARIAANLFGVPVRAVERGAEEVEWHDLESWVESHSVSVRQ